MLSANHVLSGSVSALFAMLAAPPSPEVLRSLQRIGQRVHAVSLDMQNPELTAVADRIGSVTDFEAAHRLATELAALLDKHAPPATTILIVEDDRLTARIFSDELQGSGREI